MLANVRDIGHLALLISLTVGETLYHCHRGPAQRWFRTLYVQASSLSSQGRVTSISDLPTLEEGWIVSLSLPALLTSFQVVSLYLEQRKL